MATIMLTVVIFAVVILIMSVGVIFSGRRIKGSCGGVGECACLDAELVQKERKAALKHAPKLPDANVVQHYQPKAH